MSTIELVVTQDANRKAISKLLPEQYDIETPAETENGDLSDSDLYLVDERDFSTYYGKLESRVIESDPLFCPVLLISRPDSNVTDLLSDPTDEGPMIVDQILEAPLTQTTLLRTLESLLARREQSIELNEQHDELRTFHEAIEHAGHSIYVTDTDGTIEYVNRTFEEVTGYDAEEALGLTPRIFNSGEHDEAFYADLWQTIFNGDVWENEIINERKNGEKYVINQTIAPILDKNEEPVKFVAVNQEITDRKERERRLRELHNGARRLVTAEDREQVAEYTAQAARDILGYDSAVVRYIDDGVLTPAAITEEAQATMGDRPDYPVTGDNHPATVFEQGDPRVIEDLDEDDVSNQGKVRSAMYLPIGEYGVISITDASTEAFNENDVNLVSVLTASTETALTRLDREEAIRKQNERLERYGRMVSHDLRNPLNIIENNLDIASRAEDPSEAHAEIQQAVERMSELTDEMLALAKHGKAVVNPSPEALEDLARTSWEQVETGWMSLKVDTDGEIYVDRTHVQPLFENLFRNAHDHAGPDARVWVDTLEDGFYVEDDGPGIPPDLGDDVFESGYTTDKDGTGYGLAIVEQIADAHDWAVSVTDGTDGGARFKFRNVVFA
jgi:PAS domain S-box-containing protein